jgi:hypothetical protein
MIDGLAYPFMQARREISGAAGGAKPGVMRMYKRMHIGVIYVVYERSDTNGCDVT